MKKLLLLLGVLLAAPIHGSGLSDLDQQYISEINLIKNPGFENGLQRWSKTGSSTLVAATSPTYVGSRAGLWDASAASEKLKTALINTPEGLEGATCLMSFYYLWDSGVGGDIVARIEDSGSTALSIDATLTPTAGTFKQAQVRFACPVPATQWQLVLEATANAAAITIDQAFMGNDQTVLSNVLPIVYEQTDTVTGFGGTTGTITHTAQPVPVADQQWIATLSIDGGAERQLDNGWIVDKTSTTVDYDFTSLAGADTVTVKLADTRVNSSLVNNLGVSFTYGPANVAPATTLAHGLGVVPRSIEVQHEGQSVAAQWDDITAANHCSFDLTNVYCDFSPITIDATHRIFVGVSTTVNPSYYDGQEPKFGIGSNENDSYDPNADDLLIASTTSAVGITLKSVSSGSTRINMQDAVSATGSGSIKYNNVSNLLSFGTGGVEDKFRIDASGNSQLGTIATETTNSSNLMFGVGNGNAGPVVQQIESGQSLFSHNAYHSGGGAWNRRNTGEPGVAMRLDAVSGGVSFHIAGSGANPLSNWDTTDVKMKIQSDGDTVLTVQDDGVTGNCPDGGTVCSGGTAGIACSNLGGNVASCTYDLEWMRVGNRVTLGVHGFADPNADAYSTWTVLPLPGVSAGFPANAGRGACTWGYSTTITAGIITAEVGQTRTRVEFRNTPGLDSRAWGCTIVYEVSP